MISTLLGRSLAVTTRRGGWCLDTELELSDGVKALPEMWLDGQGVAGLGEDLQKLVIRQEVEAVE